MLQKCEKCQFTDECRYLGGLFPDLEILICFLIVEQKLLRVCVLPEHCVLKTNILLR